MEIPHLNSVLASDTLPKSDAARQAVDSLRGYVYQALATALAWLDIEENGRIYLEVAEDYAILAEQALSAVQIKDTKRSGSVTLNSKSVQDVIISFVDLVNRNPDIAIELRFFTTSGIGTERAAADRPAGLAGLEYWRKVSAGADPEPLRALLDSNKFPESVRAFAKARDNVEATPRVYQKNTLGLWKAGFPEPSSRVGGAFGRRGPQPVSDSPSGGSATGRLPRLSGFVR